MVLRVASKRNLISKEEEAKVIKELNALPVLIEIAINTEDHIKEVANKYYEASNFIYEQMDKLSNSSEGALKLKEISYIHAEGYAAGELKHGPIALVDKHLPLVAIASSYCKKTVSNIEEICARKDKLSE